MNEADFLWKRNSGIKASTHLDHISLRIGIKGTQHWFIELSKLPPSLWHMLVFELEDKSAPRSENNRIGHTEAATTSIKKSERLGGKVVIEDSPKILVNPALISEAGSLSGGFSIGEFS